MWIGVKLIVPEADESDGGLTAKANIWAAIQTIMIADAVMSLDNVVAIAAVARDSVLLIVLGLLISVPLIVFGSQLVLKYLLRYRRRRYDGRFGGRSASPVSRDRQDAESVDGRRSPDQPSDEGNERDAGHDRPSQQERLAA